MFTGWQPGDAKRRFQAIIKMAHAQIEAPTSSHKKAVTTTNIYHCRKRFVEAVGMSHGQEATQAAIQVIEESVTCYAAKLHLARGYSILPKDDGTQRKIKGNYAPTFEQLTQFEDRMAKFIEGDTTYSRDLLGTVDPAFVRSGQQVVAGRDWIPASLPRMIFVSDMGDAFSRKKDFDFLNKNVLQAITTKRGRCHLWLWLTKRPHVMAEFAKQIGGFPPNVCAMTTLTGPDEGNMKRLNDLIKVKAHVRGLSLEPLWQRIPLENLDLTGIDWVIVGGESGSREFLRPFDVGWARELRDYCADRGVAFFMKQMGGKSLDGGTPIKLKDSHGGDWLEWDGAGLGDLRVREFPSHFHQYRQSEMPNEISKDRRTAWTELVADKLTSEERKRYNKLKRVVHKAARSFVDAGLALEEIKRNKLYREEHGTFEDYCQAVHQISRQYANNLVRGGKIMRELETIVSKDGVEIELPQNEAQVRELALLPNSETRVEVLAELNGNTEGITAASIHKRVEEKIGKLPKRERSPTPTQRLEEAALALKQLESALSKTSSADTEAALDRLKQILGVQ